MPTPILATKLYIPPPRPNLIQRTRLTEQLNAGLQGKLTLISAPAGFGKTTLVSNWIAGLQGAADHQPTSEKQAVSLKPNTVNHVAWLSLDEGDSDLGRFLAYAIAALQTRSPQMGEDTLALLQSPQLPPVESLLTTFLNEFTGTLHALADESEPHYILVLDDYHRLDAADIDTALTFLLDYMPLQLHIVITTREDPPLPLARYRARGQMTEVRAADLRFTTEEAAAFLNVAMGLTLSAQEIHALETRTEGWVTGLQMAALSMQGRDDSSGFIQAFTGSHRFVLDYLAEEVLQRQPEQIRDFLLQTSILKELSGPLCDAVTAQDNSQQTLERLERDNLFVVPLDDQRHWYRYHHLFADVLNTRSKEILAETLTTLHQRASEWYEQNGTLPDAIHHALVAQDLERAANLVELAWPAMHRSDFRSPHLLRWLAEIPDELIHARPVLIVGYAWELLNGGEFGAAELLLRKAERWLSLPSVDESPEAASDEMRVMDEEEFQLLPAEVASARAYLAMAYGDTSSTVAYARRALDLMPQDDYIRRGPAASLLGLAQWTDGELELGYQALSEGMDCFQKAGNVLFGIAGIFGLADIRMAQGRLHGAIATYEQALEVALEHGGRALPGTADLYLGLSEIYRERNEIDAANEYLAKSQAVIEATTPVTYQYRVALAEAREYERQQAWGEALRAFDKAEKLFAQVHIPEFRPSAAMKVRIWLAQGQLTEALQWVRARGLSVEDNLSYLREFEHMTLARVLIAQYEINQEKSALDQSKGLLERLLHAAEAGERFGSVIEILLIQALAYSAQGDISTALGSLERALKLAEPEGYIRIFVDEGEPMAKLLQAAAKQNIAPNYVSRVLATFGNAPLNSEPQPKPSPAQNLVEPLSDRELDVLRLLQTEMSGPEIARELVVSLNTMRTHSKNIYSKLGVNNRRGAVNRALDLGLL